MPRWLCDQVSKLSEEMIRRFSVATPAEAFVDSGVEKHTFPLDKRKNCCGFFGLFFFFRSSTYKKAAILWPSVFFTAAQNMDSLGLV